VLQSIDDARALLSHRSPRCPGECDFQLSCCFQTWSQRMRTDWAVSLCSKRDALAVPHPYDPDSLVVLSGGGGRTTDYV